MTTSLTSILCNLRKFTLSGKYERHLITLDCVRLILVTLNFLRVQDNGKIYFLRATVSRATIEQHLFLRSAIFKSNIYFLREQENSKIYIILLNAFLH